MDSKPSIIILYNFFYPAYKAGGPIQSLVNLVDQLKNQLTIGIICTNTDLDKTILPVAANEWVEYKQRKVFYNTHGFRNITHCMEQKSLVFINGLYSIDYNLMPALRLKNRKIVSVRGMLHPHALLQKRLKKRMYLTLWKLLNLHIKCEFHATTEQEKEHIQAVFGSKVKVWVVQNLPAVMTPLATTVKNQGELHIITIALISSMKNHLQVIKALANCKEEIVYHIYGPIKDKQYWKACCSLLPQLPSNIQVQYHGDVSPEKVSDILKDVHVYVQPSKSENFGHSLYEALASGRPVITSFNTPWNGLVEAQAGINVDPEKLEDLTAAISNFAQMDKHELSQWSKGSVEYSHKAVNVTEIRKQYLQMFARQLN